LRERPSEADLAGTPAPDPLPNPMNLPQPETAAVAAWRVENVPEGFDLALRQPAPQPGSEHLIYSDGLASVSVYIEPLTRPAAFSGASGRGAINLHGRVLDGHQITVLGDVPAATVERFAQGVVPATGG
jgi:sigma-E factor negative regulatory protein RseB